jgi:hypothetical protein
MSSTEQTAPATRGRKPRITVSPRSAETVLDTDAIIQRRLKGDPRYSKPPEIPLKDKGKWYLKEANSMADANRHYTIVHEEGYQPVTIHDLADGITPQSVGFQVAADEITLCRGPHGDERLYKMDVNYRKQIESKKTELNKKGMGSAKAVREDAANAVASVGGSEAADFVFNRMHMNGGDTEGPLGR